MSNENRDYPAWLDEELFASLTDAEAPKKNRTPPAESSVGEPPAQPGAAETSSAAKAAIRAQGSVFMCLALWFGFAEPFRAAENASWS